ncbi:MAG: exonuclease [Thaumarchaeota archaeon]|nr:exonuclease [Nitrososphaerota archaeon]
MINSSRIFISNGNGIVVETGEYSIALDPRRASNCDYALVSHAHIDHVHAPSGSSKVIASEETKRLAKSRGYDLGKTVKPPGGIELIDSGHILGSRAVLIEDRVFYTADISSRERAFLGGCKGERCDTLIMETTYGLPQYIFPETEKVVNLANKFIASRFDKGQPVILTGYQLGKAQLISYFFDNWEPVFLHESVHEMNSLHVEMGVDLKQFARYDPSDECEKVMERGPWVMIAPMSSGRSNFVKSMRQRYNAAVATFSGWALDSGYRFKMGLDEAFPMSDHCDFKELVDLAKYCNPSTVYTVHGFAEEFASHLRTLGFDAEPLSSHAQERMTSFA